MPYKTIALELLRQSPEVYRTLRRERAVLPALERYAQELKASHEAWTEQLSLAKPATNLLQTRSEALELAVQELTERLHRDSPPSDDETFWLDDAMNFLRRRTPTA